MMVDKRVSHWSDMVKTDLCLKVKKRLNRTGHTQQRPIWCWTILQPEYAYWLKSMPQKTRALKDFMTHYSAISTPPINRHKHQDQSSPTSARNTTFSAAKSRPSKTTVVQGLPAAWCNNCRMPASTRIPLLSHIHVVSDLTVQHV